MPFFIPATAKLNRLLLNVRLRIAAYFYIMNSDTGKWIIIAGLMIVVAGVIIYFFPITTMIIFSLFLTLIIQLIKKFLN
jgi:hypothetical protein